MGDYSDLISKELRAHLGWDITQVPEPTDKTIELGSRYMNELMCLPAKVTLGSYMEACQDGAKDLLMFDSCGECRLKTYWILQERALRRLGYDVTVHPVSLGKRAPGDICRIDHGISHWKAWWTFIKLLKAIKKFDDEHIIEIPEESNLPRIGLVGEIFTLLEPSVNKRLITKLEKMGTLVHNSLPLSYFIFKGLYDRGWMKRKDMDWEVLKIAKKKAHEYFPKKIGGHGIESIIHTTYYALKNFDGVIQVLPFPCMPESTVAPILDDIGHDYGMPVMRFIFDTHTGEGGMDTRLEAFTDILKMRKVKSRGN